MPFNTEPKRIERVGPSGLRVLWEGGHESLYRWEQLRAACPCAVCLPATGATAGGPAGGSVAGRESEEKKSDPAIQAVEIRPVGHYAMTIRWSDGHTTGIFSYDYLRSICSCEECKPNQFLEG